MSKCLLIAGYGFLGRAVREVFLADGWRVTCLNRSGSDGAVVCDLTSADDVAAIGGNYDLVILSTATGGGSVDDYRAVYQHACENLTSKLKGIPVIFTSSTSVYPQTDHSVVTEESPAEPTSPRALVLREAEKVVLQSGGNVARLTGVYGPGRCHALKNFLNGDATLDGEGERIVNFVHRDDAARALLCISQHGSRGEVFNINGGSASQLDIYQSLASHYGRELPPRTAADSPRKRGNTSKKISSARLHAMGWRPVYRDFLSLGLACAGPS